MLVVLCCAQSSVVSDSLQPHGLQPNRLLCPWNFLGKNTRVKVDCHFLLQGIFLTQGSNLCLLHCRQVPQESKGPKQFILFLVFFFWLCCTAYGILVSKPGVESVPPTLKVWSRNYWTTREICKQYCSTPRFLIKILISVTKKLLEVHRSPS